MESRQIRRFSSNLIWLSAILAKGPDKLVLTISRLVLPRMPGARLWKASPLRDGNVHAHGVQSRRRSKLLLNN